MGFREIPFCHPIGNVSVPLDLSKAHSGTDDTGRITGVVLLQPEELRNWARAGRGAGRGPGGVLPGTSTHVRRMVAAQWRL